MRRRLLAIVALAVLLLPLAVGAQTSVTFETVTFDNTSGGVGFTATTLQPTGGPVMTHCEGKLETAQIRIRYDGGAPTTTVGRPVDVGEVIAVDGLAYLQAFRGIRTGGSSGVIAFHCTRLQ